jgi:hypothetical protein
LGERSAALDQRQPAASFADDHQRFVQEAIAASASNHPHIVTTYDVDAIEGVDFIDGLWRGPVGRWRHQQQSSPAPVSQPQQRGQYRCHPRR